MHFKVLKMKTKNRKLISTPILILALILLLSTISYAKPFTDAFKDSLIKFNDFFEKEEYIAYSKTIDFFVFTILFTSIYLIGVKYAFREVNKPEKAIAVMLGLMSAFLMISQDYSIIKLLPFVNWFLYLLLFILIWWLLKGMKSKFWRFVLALLIILIIVVLVEGLFEFEEDFAESFVMLIPFENENKK